MKPEELKKFRDTLEKELFAIFEAKEQGREITVNQIAEDYKDKLLVINANWDYAGRVNAVNNLRKKWIKSKSTEIKQATKLVVNSENVNEFINKIKEDALGKNGNDNELTIKKTIVFTSEALKAIHDAIKSEVENIETFNEEKRSLIREPIIKHLFTPEEGESGKSVFEELCIKVKAFIKTKAGTMETGFLISNLERMIGVANKINFKTDLLALAQSSAGVIATEVRLQESGITNPALVNENQNSAEKYCDLEGIL